MITDTAPGDGGYFVFGVGVHVVSPTGRGSYCPLCWTRTYTRFFFAARADLAAALKLALTCGLKSVASVVDVVAGATDTSLTPSRIHDPVLTRLHHDSSRFRPAAWVVVTPRSSDPLLRERDNRDRVFYGVMPCRFQVAAGPAPPSVDFAQAAELDYDLVDLALIADSL